MLKFTTFCAAASLLLLSGCGPGFDPGYVCMTDCAHECPDGISGDQCRRDKYMQKKELDESQRNDDSYYYGTHYRGAYQNGYQDGAYENGYQNGYQDGHTYTTRPGD